MKVLHVSTRRREEMIDLSDAVREAVDSAGVEDGLCLVYSPHTTCGMAVNEGWDPAVQADTLQHLRQLVPHEHEFAHSEGNSDAHIKAMLVGSSAAVPVAGGRLKLGRWQAVFLCEFDGPREREVWVTVR